jgi:hypothetical protein
MNQELANLSEAIAKDIFFKAWAMAANYCQTHPSLSLSALQKRCRADYHTWLTSQSTVNIKRTPQMQHANAIQALPRDPITGALVVPLFDTKGK